MNRWTQGSEPIELLEGVVLAGKELGLTAHLNKVNSQFTLEFQYGGFRLCTLSVSGCDNNRTVKLDFDTCEGVVLHPTRKDGVRCWDLKLALQHVMEQATHIFIEIFLRETQCPLLHSRNENGVTLRLHRSFAFLQSFGGIEFMYGAELMNSREGFQVACIAKDVEDHLKIHPLFKNWLGCDPLKDIFGVG